MPIDVVAPVIARITRCRPTSNVLALAAPAICRNSRACESQFVMVKAAASRDPLLRRPFSVFEVLRERARNAHRRISLLNKRIRRLDRFDLCEAQPGRSPSRLPLARSAVHLPSSIHRPKRGWSPAASDSRRSQPSQRPCAPAA
jgi:hypothetical protein